MSKPYIPQDVRAEILLRLPVESILRFKCVSKSWNTLISSSSFITTQTHFATNLTRKTNLLLLAAFHEDDPDNSNFSVRLTDQSVGEHRKLGILLKGPYVYVDGLCHGLVCLTSEDVREGPNLSTCCYKNKTSVIWNPTLGISLALPEPKTTHYCSHVVVGFGFDRKRIDYKVIRIPNSCDCGSIVSRPRQYEVFELSRNAWRVATPSIFLPDLRNLSAIFLNGSVHWISQQDPCTIVAFNFEDEAFLEMNMPGELNVLSWLRIVVKERRYLSAIDYDEPSHHNAYWNVWVMKDYGVEESWTKLFTIHESGRYLSLKPVGFKTNGELLVMKDDMLVSYDCGNTVTRVWNNDYGYITFVGEHTETLALLQVPGGDMSHMTHKVQEAGSRNYEY